MKLVALVLLAAGCHHAAQEPATIPAPAPASAPAVDPGVMGAWAGQWKVSRYAFGRVSAVTDAQAKANVGQVADIGSASVTFLGVTCAVHRAEPNTRATDEYLGLEYRTTAAALGILDAQITAVTTDCESSPFAEFFVTHPGELVVSWDGALYFLQRQ